MSLMRIAPTHPDDDHSHGAGPGATGVRPALRIAGPVSIPAADARPYKDSPELALIWRVIIRHAINDEALSEMCDLGVAVEDILTGRSPVSVSLVVDLWKFTGDDELFELFQHDRADLVSLGDRPVHCLDTTVPSRLIHLAVALHALRDNALALAHDPRAAQIDALDRFADMCDDTLRHISALRDAVFASCGSAHHGVVDPGGDGVQPVSHDSPGAAGVASVSRRDH